MVQSIGGEGHVLKGIESIFSKIDSNADSSISKDEFSASSAEFSKIMAAKLASASSEVQHLNIDELFSKIDTDGDGSVSKDEFLDFMETHKKMPPPPPPMGLNFMELLFSGNADDIFSEIDKDGDGVISKEELIAYFEGRKEAMLDFSKINGVASSDASSTTTSSTDTASTASTV